MSDERREHDEDLSGVDPRRRALVRRRLDVLRRYLALAEPTLEDDAAHARELDLLTPSFMVLVRAYRANGSAAAIPGAKVPVKRAARDPRTPTPATEAAVSQAIDDLGPDATLVELLARTVAICSATGAPTPSLGVIHLRRAKARRSAASTGFEGFALDHVALDLPIEADDGQIRMPILTVVIDGRDAAVAGWSLATEPPSPRAAAAALRMAADRGDGAVIGPLHMAVNAEPGWATVLAALSAADVARVGPKAARLPAGATTFRALGDRLGGIRLMPRRVHAARPPSLRSRLLQTLEEAHDAIDAGIRLHNAARGLVPPATYVGASRRPRLLEALASILAGDEDGEGLAGGEAGRSQ